MNIDWVKFKQYKSRIEIKEGQNNLTLLIAYLKDVQGLHLYDDIYEIIDADELGKTMLEKSGIKTPDELMKLYFKKG